MSEEPPPSRLRRFVVIMTLVTTVLAALVAGLQVAASTSADRANRESERLTVLGGSAVTSSNIDADFQQRLVAQVVMTEQDALINGAVADEMTQKGDTQAAAEASAQAAAAQARAKRLRELSVVFTDPRYAPTSADSLPDLKGYLADQEVAVNAITVRQNAASDAYQSWNGKSDAYVGVLSVLAVAFFLLGIGQVASRTRALLAVVATVLVIGSIVWTTGTYFS